MRSQYVRLQILHHGCNGLRTSLYIVALSSVRFNGD